MLSNQTFSQNIHFISSFLLSFFQNCHFFKILNTLKDMTALLYVWVTCGIFYRLLNAHAHTHPHRLKLKNGVQLNHCVGAQQLTVISFCM
uniref:Uncharacterized protein n=1 Tax=Anguilla anguilla TaxID=7936 RepID=A0A0E9XKR7_ANGAN